VSEREEYFRAGVRLVWEAYPQTRVVKVFTALDRSTTVSDDDTLDGGEVLPGFKLSVRNGFARAKRSSSGSYHPSWRVHRSLFSPLWLAVSSSDRPTADGGILLPPHGFAALAFSVSTTEISSTFASFLPTRSRRRAARS
jgi:hypothetical protein